MSTKLESLITEVSLRMRLLDAKHEGNGNRVEIGATQLLMLELLSKRQIEKLSDITHFFRGVAESTISTELSELHKKHYVEKGINPLNQRERTVKLTDEGATVLERIKANRSKRLKVLMKAFGGVSEAQRKVLEEVLESILPSLDEVLEKNEFEQAE